MLNVKTGTLAAFSPRNYVMELDELYQQIILDHAKRPRNYGEVLETNHTARGENPACGDEVVVFLKISPEKKIEQATFTGHGCAISQAAASLLTIQLKGKTLEEGKNLLQNYQTFITRREQTENIKLPGNLMSLGGVHRFPQRIKCATLASHAFLNAIEAKFG